MGSSAAEAAFSQPCSDIQVLRRRTPRADRPSWPRSRKESDVDDKRYAAGQKLLDAAYEFWKACHAEGQYGAVQWLTGTNGELIIFTRGEYRTQLMNNIHLLNGVSPEHKFGEEMSEDCRARELAGRNAREPQMSGNGAVGTVIDPAPK
jgi:hypothetical protein